MKRGREDTCRGKRERKRKHGGERGGEIGGKKEEERERKRRSCTVSTYMDSTSLLPHLLGSRVNLLFPASREVTLGPCKAVHHLH